MRNKKNNLAEILAANVRYLKINNIEADLGLTKTALQRIIARKEIPEKYREKIENWWSEWVKSLFVNSNEQLQDKIIYAAVSPENLNGLKTKMVAMDEQNVWEGTDKNFAYYDAAIDNLPLDPEKAGNLLIEIKGSVIAHWRKTILEAKLKKKFEHYQV